MQRKLDLLKKLLEEIEIVSGPSTSISSSKFEIEGYSYEQIDYHIELCLDAGLIEAEKLATKGGVTYYVKRLTWRGHEFLDNIRNDTVMKKVKKTIQEKGGSFAFEAIIEFASATARGLLLGGA